MNDSLVGRRLGQYELNDLIGRGGMAQVYRAAQPRIDRDVAIKVIIEKYARHPAFVQRFEREMRASATLQHPHILPVYDVGTEGDQLFMVMAYLPGGTLARRIAGLPGGLPLEQVICITSQVAAALDYAHAQNIVHRDVKPGNILLDSRGNAYLSDFGVARLADENLAQAMGTFAYMAPEVAEHQPATPASDIFSLGVVIFEMLAGVRPFEAHDRESLLALHAEPAPSLKTWRPDLPPGMQVVVDQALSRVPSSRPPHASSLAQALQKASGLTGLPCADLLDERPAPSFDVLQKMQPVRTYLQEEEEWDGPYTPPPDFPEWQENDHPDTDPAGLEAPPATAPRAAPVDLPPTAVALTTHVHEPTVKLPATAATRKQTSSYGPVIALLWIAAVFILLGAAVLSVIAISMSGG